MVVDVLLLLLQVHGDVFRPPSSSSLLSTFVGTGVQLFGMTVVTMIFAVLGFLSPANRGGLTTAMLMMFVFMGLFAGYFSARLYKSFRGEEWKKTTLRTALMFPGAGRRCGGVGQQEARVGRGARTRSGSVLALAAAWLRCLLPAPASVSLGVIRGTHGARQLRCALTGEAPGGRAAAGVARP